MNARSIFARSAVFVSIVVGTFSTPCHASVRQDSGCRSSSSPGQWSAAAIDLSWLPHEPHRDFCVSSPDHAKVVRVVDDEWWIETDYKRISRKWAALMYFELQWSPDSQSFYTTQSEGFTTHYAIDVYRLKGKAVEHYSRNLNRIVISDFNQHHKCWDEAFQSGNDPNIAGLTWVDDSRDLIVVAQVPAIGICGDKMRYFGGYSVSLSTGRITNRFSPDELAKRWKQVLGQHLQDDLGLLAENEKDVLP
jgi:hypothetical protein